MEFDLLSNNVEESKNKTPEERKFPSNIHTPKGFPILCISVQENTPYNNKTTHKGH